MSRKDWCLQNHVPLSTLGYWLRKFRQPETDTGNAGNIFEPVFGKLPSGQDFPWDADAPVSPVTIHLPENIRIEVAADCPAGLIAALLQTLRNYA